MPVRLLDVNLLIPLLWKSHPGHDRIEDWFLRHRGDGWATCPLTELSFVRISCTPGVMPASPTVEAAAGVLKRWTVEEDHHFWPADLSVMDALSPSSGTVRGHKQLTDAYLIALAKLHGGVLATLDRPLFRLDGVEAVD